MVEFMDMTKGLIAGKFARRAIWTLEDGYLVLLPGIKLAWKILTNPMPNAGGYPFTIDDFLANDWILSDPCHDSDVIVKLVENVIAEAA